MTGSNTPTFSPNAGDSSISTNYVSGQDSSYGSFTGTQSYKNGSPVTLQATPQSGCGFLGWASDAKGTKFVSYYNPYTFTVLANVTLYPVFIKNSQTVVLKDDAVKKGVQEAIGKTTYTYGDLQKVDKLYVKSPKSLDDLKYFYSITFLHVDFVPNSDPWDISVMAGLVNLETFNSSYAPVNVLPFENYKNLITLQIEYSGSDASSLTKNKATLDTLGLDHSPNVKDFNFISGMTKLTYLNLSGCWLSDITFLSKMTQLTGLWLSDNLITDISPLSGLTNLSQLLITNNRITDLSPLDPLYSKNLAHVDFQYNPIKDYSFLNHTSCSFSPTGAKLTNDQISQAVAAAKDMVNSLIKPELSDSGKYQVLASGLCAKTTYDTVYNIPNNPLNDYDSTAYGALVMGHSICSGYSDAYMMLCTMADLPCYCCEGIVLSNVSVTHMWNIVKIDDSYYHADITFMDAGDPAGPTFFYFLKSDSYFLQHGHSDFYRAPDLICSDTSWDTFDNIKIGM